MTDTVMADGEIQTPSLFSSLVMAGSPMQVLRCSKLVLEVAPLLGSCAFLILSRAALVGGSLGKYIDPRLRQSASLASPSTALLKRPLVTDDLPYWSSLLGDIALCGLPVIPLSPARKGVPPLPTPLRNSLLTPSHIWVGPPVHRVAAVVSNFWNLGDSMESVLDLVGPCISDAEYESLWRNLWVLEDDITIPFYHSREEVSLQPDFANAIGHTNCSDPLEAHSSIIGSQSAFLVNDLAPAAVLVMLRQLSSMRD
ncbi:unnamed protein product [Calypogeia fissa]